jgi:PPOX class probable F420-dependent enzyme
LRALDGSISQSVAAQALGRSLSLRSVVDGGPLIEPVRQFLSAPRCAVLSTIGPDGAPRQIVIHYTLGKDHIRLNGHRDRRWVANVRRDSRVALIVHDEHDYLHYVSIRGRAALVDAGEDALAEAMSQAERYGEDPADFAGQPRVSFRLDPEHVHEYR